MYKPAILVVTGASGAGKTTAVQCLEDRRHPDVRCSYFDRIGVPAPEVMDREFGGPEAWQAVTTKRWMKRLAEDNNGSIRVLDGQTRPSFVYAAAALNQSQIRVILLDCNPAVRLARLIERGQPELATAQMNEWADYLRGQAVALGLPVIDTSERSISEVTDGLEAEVDALRAEARGGNCERLTESSE